MYWDFDPGSSTIWVFAALVLFIALLLWKGVHKTMAKALDDRAETIRKDLAEAAQLREDAQALLSEYQRKQSEAEAQAKSIVDQAKKDADTMAKQARDDLAERIARRAELAESKIANAEAQAISDVKARAVELAAKASEDILRKKLKAADHSKLIKDGIADLGKALN